MILDMKHCRVLLTSVPPGQVVLGTWEVLLNPCLALRRISPQSKMFERKSQLLELQILSVEIFVSFDNFQIALVSVPIAQVSVPPAPHRQCQGKWLMLN